MLVFHWEHSPQISFFITKLLIFWSRHSDLWSASCSCSGRRCVCEIWECVSEEQMAAWIFQQIKSFCLFLLCCHQSSAADLNKDARVEKFLRAVGRMGHLSFLHTHTAEGGLGAGEQTELGHRSMSLRPKAIYTFHTHTHTHTDRTLLSHVIVYCTASLCCFVANYFSKLLDT